MVTIAAVGVVVALLGTMVAWRLVGELHHTVDDSLLVTNEALATIEDTVVLADAVIADVSAALVTLDATLVRVEQGVGDARPLIDDVGQLSSDVPQALGQLQRTLAGVGSAAGEIDAVLAQLSALPFGPRFDPQATLSGQIDRLSDDLDPIIDTLETTSADVEQLAASTETLQDDIAALSADVTAISGNLQESARLVTSYRDQATRAATLAADSRADLEGNVRAVRLLIVVAGLLYAASQFVPLWVGAELLAGPDPRDLGRT
jgi:methyl-accepting chemotaxis protein